MMSTDTAPAGGWRRSVVDRPGCPITVLRPAIAGGASVWGDLSRWLADIYAGHRPAAATGSELREQIDQHVRRVADLVRIYGHGQLTGIEVTRWYRDDDDIVVCVSRSSRLEKRPLGPEADTTGVLDGVEDRVSTDTMLADPTRSVARIAREVARHKLALAEAGRRADAYAVNVVRQALMTLAATLADQVGRPDVVQPSVRESLRRAADACLDADDQLVAAVFIPTAMSVAPTAAAGRAAYDRVLDLLHDERATADVGGDDEVVVLDRLIARVESLRKELSATTDRNVNRR